jgi:hypothetical protein
MKHQKITKHLFEQVTIHILKTEVYVTYLTNVNIDNNPVDFKSEQSDFYNLKRKERTEWYTTRN